MSAFRSANSTAPAHGAVSVTPSDSAEISPTRALYIGVSGDVAVTMADGQSVIFVGAPVGVLPIQVSQVRSTGTTATNILALY